MAEQVAIIRNVKMGNPDGYGPGLYFTTYITESSAASQSIGWDEAREIVASVGDIRELEGKPCWVDVEGQMIRFRRPWKP